jgi:hypothetical protein
MPAGIFALLALGPAAALAQVLPGGGLAGPLYPQPGSGSLYPTPIPPQGGVRGSPGGPHHGFHGRGLLVVPVTEVVHDVVVVHDQPAEPPAPPPPPPPPKEPWVLGKIYAALPGGCMKMVERAGKASYFYCGGDWYRQIGSARYKAVTKPL